MSDMVLYTAVGRLTRDADTKVLPTGKVVTGFTVASNPSWNKDDPAVFMDCQMWGERGQKLSPYLTKGAKVLVTGTLKRVEWPGKDGETKSKFQVDLSDVNLLGDRQNQGSDQGGHAQSASPAAAQVDAAFSKKPAPAAQAAQAPMDFDDDIPF